jgi:hypothetical protein
MRSFLVLQKSFLKKVIGWQQSLASRQYARFAGGLGIGPAYSLSQK